MLLILTDGVITDMDNTIRAIIDASRLPLSIIIVGVGSANFDNMNVLDADDEPLRANGKVMARDIVQFVPFRDFQSSFANEGLAEAVLAEVPEQFVQYMTQNRIQPRAPPRADTMVAMNNGNIAYTPMQSPHLVSSHISNGTNSYGSPSMSSSFAGGSISMSPQLIPDRLSYMSKR